MKINLPVTTTERFLEPGKPIVTKTDAKGRIIYANESFVTISGFTREELIGQNHNVVRHPDMPPEAFKDLWTTVKSGRPWRGMVKNRTKEGDFYWVEALVTPMTDDGKIIGYISVRNTPNRIEVEQAEALYRAVREQRASYPYTKPEDTGAKSLITIFSLIALAAVLPWIAALQRGTAGFVAAGLSSVFAVLLAYLLRAEILGQIEGLYKVIERLDEGKIGQPLKKMTGVFGRVGLMVESLRVHYRAIFADVVVSTADVSEQSAALRKVLQDLAKTARSQSESIEQIAAAMEEVSVSINEISDNNRLSVKAVHRTRDVADTALEAMRANMRSGTLVVEAVQSTQGLISEVSSSVQKISEITQIIRDIAEQTNLLALNAAIEAARAGEQGRGFAVVADEVRKLAERTASSTSHIAAAVEEISHRTERAVEAMSTAAEGVLRSSSEIEASSKSLEAINEASQEASRVASDISEMLVQQSAASHQVAEKMEAISGTLQDNDRNITVIGESVKELHDAVEEMTLLTAHLKASI